VESVFDSLRIPVDSSLANNSLTSSCPRWLSGYECGRAPKQKHQHSRRQKVTIRNLLHFHQHISQYTSPSPSCFFHFFYFKLFNNSFHFMSSPWLISSLATASFVMYSEVLSWLPIHTFLLVTVY